MAKGEIDIQREFSPVPRWVNDVLEDAWPRIVSRIPAKWVPVIPYGCGGFGCVLPTSGGEDVIKITKDEDEAKFVSWCMGGRGRARTGIVRYRAVFRFSDGPNYAIVREMAYDVGGGSALDTYTTDRASVIMNRMVMYARDAEGSIAYSQCRLGAVEGLLDEAAEIAAEFVSDVIDEDWPSPAATRRFRRQVGSLHRHKATASAAANLEVFRMLAGKLSEIPAFRHVAEAVIYYYENGILLPDIRLENIGRVVRGGFRPWVIIDPSIPTIFGPEVKIPKIKVI